MKFTLVSVVAALSLLTSIPVFAETSPKKGSYALLETQEGVILKLPTMLLSLDYQRSFKKYKVQAVTSSGKVVGSRLDDKTGELVELYPRADKPETSSQYFEMNSVNGVKKGDQVFCQNDLGSFSTFQEHVMLSFRAEWFDISSLKGVAQHVYFSEENNLGVFEVKFQRANGQTGTKFLPFQQCEKI